MSGFGQVLAFGAGALCLGVVLTLAALLSISSRHDDSGGEGCLGWMLIVPFMVLAGYLFIVAVRA